MRRPLFDLSHRPHSLYLRARPEWAELLPHSKQIGVEVLFQEAHPKWDWTFGDLYAQVERARTSIGGVEYADLDMMNDEEIEDACGTMLSEVLPVQNLRPRFHYD
jgi:hypothetical protein